MVLQHAGILGFACSEAVLLTDSEEFIGRSVGPWPMRILKPLLTLLCMRFPYRPQHQVSPVFIGYSHIVSHSAHSYPRKFCLSGSVMTLKCKKKMVHPCLENETSPRGREFGKYELRWAERAKMQFSTTPAPKDIQKYISRNAARVILDVCSPATH